MECEFKLDVDKKDEEFVVSAPGKAIIHGEHAVVHGKKAIAASVDLRCYLRLRPVPSSDDVHLDVPDLGITCSWPVAELQDLAANCSSTPTNAHSEACETQLNVLSSQVAGANAVNVLAAKTFLFLAASIYFHGRTKSPGLVVSVASGLPFAAGLGSSASYSVCLAAACLLARGELHSESCQTASNQDADSSLLENLGLPDSSNWETSSLEHNGLELVRAWSFEGERLIHGTPSGIDNAVATFGGALEFCRSPTGDQIRTIDKPPVLRILLTNTKVPRSTKVLVAGVRTWLNDLPDIANPILDAVDGISKQCCVCWKQLEHGSREESQLAFHRLEHLIDVNQSLLKCMGVSHPAIEAVCRITADCGLHSKLTGAGGGGCVLTLYSPDSTSPEDIAVVKEKLLAAGYGVYDTVLGGAGVTVHHRRQ